VPSLAGLLDNLVLDEWRESHPFSTDFAACQSALWSALDDATRATLLGDWLFGHQPCLFGRIAAKAGSIDYCFLTERDLSGDDREVAGKIAMARLEWRRRARPGGSHAFVIAVLCKRLALAEPNPALMEFSQHLGELYLCRPVLPDTIEHDELFLEATERRSWKVGVNFFSAQGDGRWWKDHRIPGGIAFSMNSVGHMACARRLKKEMDVSDQSHGLNWALGVAMGLLDKTTDGPSGRDTWLHSVVDVPPTTECPAKLAASLGGKNWCQYGGLYHTDQTIPSAYFTPAEKRREGPKQNDLDLTYLHLDSPDNPDYARMGVGEVRP
jgi:hypothetical protein